MQQTGFFSAFSYQQGCELVMIVDDQIEELMFETGEPTGFKPFKQ